MLTEKEIFMLGTLVGSLIIVILQILVLAIFHYFATGTILVIIAAINIIGISYGLYNIKKSN